MKTLAFYQMKGGVGKTTTAVNIAYLSAAEGKRTLLWDLDPQGAATYYVRVKPEVDAKTKKLLKGKEDLGDLIKATEYADLDLMPGDFSLRHMDVVLGEVKKSKKRLKRLTKSLKDDYEVIVFDCPPSISLLSENVFRAADLLVLPVIPSPLSLQALDQVRRYLLDNDLKEEQLATFFSMVDRRKNLHKQTVDQVDPTLNMCATAIPTRSLIEKMGVERAPLPAFSPKSAPAQAYRSLWKELQARL